MPISEQVPERVRVGNKEAEVVLPMLIFGPLTCRWKYCSDIFMLCLANIVEDFEKRTFGRRCALVGVDFKREHESHYMELSCL